MAEPRVWLFVFLAGYVIAGYVVMVALPDEFGDLVLRSMGFGFLVIAVGLLAIRELVTKTYRFDPRRRMVAETVKVGPVPVRYAGAWHSFDECRGLNMQLIRHSFSADADPKGLFFRSCH